MNDNFTTFILSLAGVGLSGFVAWTIRSVIRMRQDHDAFRLYVSEQYIKKDDLHDVKVELRQLRDVIIEIAGKLNVSIRN